MGLFWTTREDLHDERSPLGLENFFDTVAQSARTLALHPSWVSSGCIPSGYFEDLYWYVGDAKTFGFRVAETAPTLLSYRLLQLHLFWKIAMRSAEMYRELLKDLAENLWREAWWTAYTIKLKQHGEHITRPKARPTHSTLSLVVLRSAELERIACPRQFTSLDDFLDTFARLFISTAHLHYFIRRFVDRPFLPAHFPWRRYAEPQRLSLPESPGDLYITEVTLEMNRLQGTEYASWEQREGFEERWKTIQSPERVNEIAKAEENLVEALIYLGDYKYEVGIQREEMRRRETQIKDDGKLARKLQTEWRWEEYGVWLPVWDMLSYTFLWRFPDDV